MQLSGDDFTLRPVMETQADLNAVLAVYQQCEDFLALGPVATASMSMVLADLALAQKEGEVFYGIYDAASAEMLGVVCFTASGYQHDPHLADLSLLMIAGPRRGCGLGAKVVQVVEAEIRRAGQAACILSGVQVNNPGAIRFWQRMGYHITSGPRQMEDSTVTYALRKELPPAG